MGAVDVQNPGDPVEVRLIKDPRPDVVYPAEAVADDGDHVVVRAEWSGPDFVDSGYIQHVRGDVWTEHFWRSRWFTIKEIRSEAGELKGWYCDVTRPAVVTPGQVVAADLELDVWISADRGTILRLDEDEFHDSGLAEREPDVAAKALASWDELDRLARTGGALDELLSW